MSILQKLNKPHHTVPEGPRPPFPVVVIGSGFGTGFSPVAPGTAGSLLALAIALIPEISNPTILVPLIALGYSAGGFAATAMERWRGPDPGVVTIDEVIGMWISILFLPQTPLYLLGAFFLFRIFDILKPWPASFFDSRPGGWNIMLDDVVAGVYANCILHFVRWMV